MKSSYDDADTPFISKQKEIINKLVDQRNKIINDLDEKVNNIYII